MLAVRHLFAQLAVHLYFLLLRLMDLLRPATDEPPAKITSPDKAGSASTAISKRARKKASKQRLAEQNNETQTQPTTPKSTAANLSRRNAGANWLAAANANGAQPTKKAARPVHPTPPKNLPVNDKGIKITKHIAMDCEMVGIGYGGKKHMVARVSVVNQLGEVLIDRYVRPREPVIDYRTEVSGIRPANIASGVDYDTIRTAVAELLENRILVGHAVYNDLKVLALQHPTRAIRDTSRYRPLINRITGGTTPSLKTLARCVLDVNIQMGEHSSVEDARAAMRIYNRYQEEWERYVRKRNN